MTLIDFKVEKDLHQILNECDREVRDMQRAIDLVCLVQISEYNRKKKELLEVNLHSDP